jgi:hypothetical protein
MNIPFLIHNQYRLGVDYAIFLAYKTDQKNMIPINAGPDLTKCLDPTGSGSPTVPRLIQNIKDIRADHPACMDPGACWRPGPCTWRWARGGHKV